MKIRTAIAIISSLTFIGIAGIGGVLLYKYSKGTTISKEEKQRPSSETHVSKITTTRNSINKSSNSKTASLIKNKIKKRQKWSRKKLLRGSIQIV